MDAVPFLNLHAQYDDLKNEVDSAIADVLKSSAFVAGPAVESFEGAFARYCDVKYCVSLNSGTAALHLALLAMGIGPGDEVITAANSFIATAEAISFCGAVPVFVDAKLETANLDASALSKAITAKTKAIIPVHLYGQPAEIEPIMNIAAEHGIMVLEDACQAHGATYKGRPVGSFGKAAAFSFYPGKNLGCAGDGGAVVTNDEEIAERIKLLRNHGSDKKYHHKIIGHNFRLDTIQAAILNTKLPHLDLWNKKRSQIAATYNRAFAGVYNITPIMQLDDLQSVFHLYVIRTGNREIAEKILQDSKISYGIHYPVPIHLQPAYEYLGLGKGSFKNSELLSESVISLPIFAELKNVDQERVIEAVKKISQVV